jgi:hypothetical protein
MRRAAAAHVAAIYNAAWFVRYYCRPGQREQRARAIRKMGLAVRAAFDSPEPCEPLLYAVCDSLALIRDLRPPAR